MGMVMVKYTHCSNQAHQPRNDMLLCNSPNYQIGFAEEARRQYRRMIRPQARCHCLLDAVPRVAEDSEIERNTLARSEELGSEVKSFAFLR